MSCVIRAARRDETRLLGRLFRIASEGLADYNWSRLTRPGEDLLDVAERRLRRRRTEFSYENAFLAEVDGQVAGFVHLFAIPPNAVPSEAELAAMDPVIRPLAELDVPGSYYVAALAVLPGQRARGIGTRLMTFADERARQLGHHRMSVAVYERNTAALRLYRRLGYREVGRRPLVQHPPFVVEGDVLMLAKAV